MLARNPGHCPSEASGKRVRVILRNGTDNTKKTPSGWPADGRDGCNWSTKLGPFSIEQWEVING